MDLLPAIKPGLSTKRSLYFEKSNKKLFHCMKVKRSVITLKFLLSIFRITKISPRNESTPKLINQFLENDHTRSFVQNYP